MNMFLQVVASKAAPTTDTFVAVTTFDATSDDDKATVFYEKDETTKKYKIVTEADGTANDGLFTDADKFKVALAAAYGKKLYKQTTTIGPEITGAQLSDVTFPSEADDDTLLGAATFAEGKENKANVSIGFLLGGAKYGIDSDEGIEAFTTSQSDLTNSMDLRELGGTAGFTITGVMNKKTDWTKADTAALFIQPTYKVSDTEGSETYVNGSISDAGVNSTNPYNQIKLGAQLAVTAGGLFTVSGLSSNNKFKDLTATNGGTAYSLTENNRGTWTPSIPTESSEGTYSCQLSENWMNELDGLETTVVFTYVNENNEEVEISKTIQISKD